MLVKIRSWSARGPNLVFAGGASAAFCCWPENDDVLKSFTEDDAELAAGQGMYSVGHTFIRDIS